MRLEHNKPIRGLMQETATRRSSSTSNLDQYLFLMYDKAENVISHTQVVPKGKRTIVAASDNCGYFFSAEIQNSAKLLLLSKAIFKPRSLDKSSNASINSAER